MSNKISGDDQDKDLEAQLKVSLKNSRTGTNPKDRWRQIFVILSARRIFLSYCHKGSLAVDGFSLSTISFADIGPSTDTKDDALELTEPCVSQVSTDINPRDNDADNGNSVQLQRENIVKIVRAKDLGSLRDFGNVEGFAEALNTDLEKGITGEEEDCCCRRPLPSRNDPEQGLFHFLLNACNKYTFVLLLLCAILSAGFGIIEEGLHTGWCKGAIIFLAIVFIVVVHTARWYFEMVTPSRKTQMVANVVRGGQQQKISFSNIVIGDIVCLETGQVVPADGLLIIPVEPVEPMELDGELDSTTIDEQNPFMFHGAKVINGNGRMLVTSVGTETLFNEMMSSVTDTLNKKTPFQIQIDKLNSCTQIIGLLICALIIVVLFLRFQLGKENNESGFPDLRAKPTAIREFVNAMHRIVMDPMGKIRSAVITSISMSLIGVTEGIPFVITLALTYWNKKTLSQKGTIRNLLARLTMGSVTTICVDKNYGLISNQMDVEMLYIDEQLTCDDSELPSDVHEHLCNGICTPALRQQDCSSATAEALLSWASQKLGKTVKIPKPQCSIIETRNLESNEGCGVLMRINGDDKNSISTHWQGQATRILDLCSHYCDITGEIKPIDGNKRIVFQQIIKDMQEKHLKTIACAYKNGEVQILEENQLILVVLLGLKQSSRKAIEACKSAGLNIILVSGDNVAALETIAVECGIHVPNSDAVVLGESFRNLTEEERMSKVDSIRIMGESQASDRLLLVKCLREKGHVVAVVGFRTDEIPALKEADVGITTGNQGSEMARQTADIIIPDGSIDLLMGIMRHGQYFYENIQKFIQVELIISISWFLMNIITIVCFGDATITAIQLFWVYLIAAIPGGLVLLTETPIKNLTERPPVRQIDPLITRTMWRNIVIQALYQNVILVTFQFKGKDIMGIKQKVSKTMIFNSFVLCHVFNLINAREMKKKNVFKGIHQDHWFWLAAGITVVSQEAFIEIAHILASSVRLNGQQWAVCFLIGMVSLVIDWAAKCISEVIGWLTRPRTSNSGSTDMTPLLPQNP